METGFQILATEVDVQGGSRAKKALAEKLSVMVSLAKGNTSIVTFAEVRPCRLGGVGRRTSSAWTYGITQ